MNNFYCTKCKKELESPQSWYMRIDDPFPTLRGYREGDAAEPLTPGHFDRLLEKLRSPTAKGLACAKCEKAFEQDETRWTTVSFPITHEDLAKRIVYKYEWTKVVSLSGEK